MAAAPVFAVLGKPIPRVEGPDKVSGRAVYSADVTPANALWAKNVRSPVPHARIVSIHTARALAVPGVRAVLTAAGFPNKRIGRRLKDYPVLCDDQVRFVGDKVAVVAAEDPDAAEEGALLVEVEYEELPAVFDPIAAMLPGAPLIHPEARSYVGFPPYIPEDLPNVCAYLISDRGDVAAGFAQSDMVVEHTFRTQLVHQAYLEPHACVVTAPEGGRIEIWASSKVPFNLRRELAEIIDRRQEDLLVHRVNLGGDFGSKGAPADVPTAYYLARMTGRPVKVVTSYQEDLIAAAPRSPSVVTLRTGLKRDGTILARDALVVFDSGAYGAFRPAVFDGMLGGANDTGGSYEIPNLHVEARIVYTNQVPCGYMRSPGQPQVIFAVEAHMDLLARELGMDPLELRLRNAPRRSPSGGVSVAPELLQTAADAVGWSSPKPPLVGRGMAMAERGTGVGTGSSDITVNPDGTVTVVTSLPDNGTGGLTVVAQVVAEAWGIPIERVHLVHGDTDALPVDVEAGASRMTNVAGHAVIAASDKLKEQLAPFAASMLGTEGVHWEKGGWRAPNGRTVSLEELAAEMIKPGDPAAHAQATITTPRSPDRGYCAQAAEVEVDPETGQVRVRKIASAQDVGTIINEIGHQGQIEGAVVQAMGYGLMEELVVQDGQITTTHLGDYKVPTVRDIPELATVDILTTGPGPFNAKGIGETPVVPGAAAIANAVADAIGAPIFQLPVTAERVLDALDPTRAVRRASEGEEQHGRASSGAGS